MTNAESSTARHWQIADHAIATVLLCYILSEFCLEPAVKYLEGYASSHKWPAKSKGDLVVMIEELSLGADMATLAVLLHPASVQYDTAANMTRGLILFFLAYATLKMWAFARPVQQHS